MSGTPGPLSPRLPNRVDQLPNRLDLGLLVYSDEDVELSLDRSDEIEHGQAVPLKILREPSIAE